MANSNLVKKFGQHQKVNKELLEIFTAHRNKLEKKKKPMFVSEDNIYALYKNEEASAGGHGEFGNLYLQDTHFDSYPEDGKLVVFPPHLKHMPFPYASNEDRVIVSFHVQVHNPNGFKYNYSFN